MLEITRLTETGQSLLNAIDKKIDPIQEEIDVLMVEYQSTMEPVLALQAIIKEKRALLGPLVEMKAGVASRRSRVKYFPEFATRNHDDSKDAEYKEFVRSQLG